MHEIVTLQLGKQSNYLGTHFWNLQESYFTYSGEQESPVDHDVHFRLGRAYDGTDTFTPRTVIYDFKREFGALKKINGLYEALGEPSQASAWGGKTTTQRNPVVEEHDYQHHLNLGTESSALSADKIRFWSDFNRVYYHPRSLIQIYETELGPEQRAFTTWEAGEDLFESLDRENDLFERDVRPFIEECDQMQGLQMLTSVDDGWSGFASKYMDRLRDELGKGTIWVLACQEASTPQQQKTSAGKLVNKARSLLAISPQASIYIPTIGAPIDLPKSISMDRTSLWCTSALLTTAFETMTLPSRLKNLPAASGMVSLQQMAFLLEGAENRNIVHLGLSVEHTSSSETSAVDPRLPGSIGITPKRTLAECNFMPRYKPSVEKDEGLYSKIEVHRGIIEEEPIKAANSGDRPDLRQERYHSDLTIPVLDSFPKLYSDESEVQNIRTSLTTSSAIRTWVKDLELATKWRVEREEREDFSNGLLEIAERYKKGEDYSDDEDGWDD